MIVYQITTKVNLEISSPTNHRWPHVANHSSYDDLMICCLGTRGALMFRSNNTGGPAKWYWIWSSSVHARLVLHLACACCFARHPDATHMSQNIADQQAGAKCRVENIVNGREREAIFEIVPPQLWCLKTDWYRIVQKVSGRPERSGPCQICMTGDIGLIDSDEPEPSLKRIQPTQPTQSPPSSASPGRKKALPEVLAKGGRM